MTNMQWTKVVSSNLEAVGYNPETKEAQVEFKNQSIYSYADVPAEMIQAFLESPKDPQYGSVGKFFAQKFKTAGYKDTKIKEAAPKAPKMTKAEAVAAPVAPTQVRELPPLSPGVIESGGKLVEPETSWVTEIVAQAITDISTTKYFYEHQLEPLVENAAGRRGLRLFPEQVQECKQRLKTSLVNLGWAVATPPPPSLL